jgi:acyl carrier protein
VFSLEEAFQIEMAEEELWQLRTVRDLCNAVSRAVAASCSAKDFSASD